MANANKQSIVDILREVTHFVKIFPFILVAFHMVATMLYSVLPDEILSFLDLLIYASPVMVFFIYKLSKKLQLCKWHRFECLLPLYGVIMVLVDSFLYTLPLKLTMFNISLTLMLFSCSLVNAYHVFIKPYVRR